MVRRQEQWGDEAPLPAAGAVGGPPDARLIRLRLMIVGLSISLWATAVFVRLVHLQVFARESLGRQAARQSERTIRLDPRRGRILDRNGRDLAVSVDVDSIYADPQAVDDPEGTVAALARVLEMDADTRERLLARLESRRAFAWVRRKVDPVTARAVRELQLPGVDFLTETRRYYPKRELAAHLLGYVGIDNKGMSGIEYSFDEYIRGQAAQVVVRTDARRRQTGLAEQPSTDGHTVILTIDERIQHVAEQELARAVARTRAQAGVIVVLEPRTGEILALANRPTFNPNRFGDYSRSHRRNRAVLDAFEPGSIFKIVTAAAGLEQGVVTPDEIIDCGDGWIEIAGRRINDHNIFDQLPFRQVMTRSSDIGVIRVAQRVGAEGFDRYVRRFGFGEPTEVGLPGEASGILRPTSRWSALSLASLSFGQEIGVTALQMTAATAAVANGGYLMRPRIVRQVTDPAGLLVREWKPLAVRRVLEPETVDTLTEILRQVVVEGTGRHAAVDGYSVAGKTGTAQKVDASGSYSMIDHVASFVGFAPVSRPAVVILVSLDTPRGERNEGGDVAAPVFARVAEAALRHLAIPPDDSSRVLRMLPWHPERHTPVAMSPLAPPPSAEPGLMPDLRGRSAREAAIAAARRGLIVELTGSGRVVEQHPAPGAEITPGDACRLTLSAQPAPAPDPPPARSAEAS